MELKIVISLDLTKLLECLVWLQRFTSSQCCHQKSFFCLWLEDWSVNSNCWGFIDIPSQLPAIATLTHPFLVTNRARRGDSDVSVITLNISHSVSLTWSPQYNPRLRVTETVLEHNSLLLTNTLTKLWPLRHPLPIIPVGFTLLLLLGPIYSRHIINLL